MLCICASRRKLRKSSWLPGRRPRSRSEQFGADAICEMTRLLPPKRTLCAGLRAWIVNSGGACAISSRIMSLSKRTRSLPSRTSAPCSFMILRAPSCSTSTPISFSTRSEARWIDSSSSSEISLVGANGILQLPERRLLEGGRTAGALSRAAAAARPVRRRAPVRRVEGRRSWTFLVAVRSCGGIMDRGQPRHCGGDDH